jgi:hypothetical protein
MKIIGMRRMLSGWVALLVCFFVCGSSFAQQGDQPVDYLNQLSNPSDKLLRESWEYMSASAHSKNPKAIEDRRKALVKSITDYLAMVKAAKPYKGDDAYRQSVLKYLSILLPVFNQDYEKIVDMKEVAEQSYDLFEAYILAQKKANDKLEESSKILTDAEKTFAAKYKIILTITESELSKKIKQGSDAIDYYNEIHLIFFKPLKQEAYLLVAQESGDIGKMEQNRKTLLKDSMAGIKLLSSEKKYEGDDSLISICNKALQFYKVEAEEKTPLIIDYMMKNDSFAKIKKSYDAKSDSEKTQEVVDQFNAKVDEVNLAVKKSNKAIEEMNNERSGIIDEWNNAMAGFMDKHVPQ